MTSNDRTDEPILFGVPGRRVRDALLAAGVPPEGVTAMLARGYAESASRAGEAALAEADPAQDFHFQVQIAQVAPECALTYQRQFVHPDFVEGVTVVQAEPSPEDPGFNLRFHAIEAEFDAIAVELLLSSNCVAELRRELYELTQELAAKITEIDARLNAKPKDKDGKETKEKDTKEGKETKEKDTKEGKDKEHKDGKEQKEKDHKEAPDKALPQEKFAPHEQIVAPLEQAPGAAPAGPARTGTSRPFISLEDRPDVGTAALQEEAADPPPPSRRKAAASKQSAPRRARTARPRPDQGQA